MRTLTGQSRNGGLLRAGFALTLLILLLGGCNELPDKSPDRELAIGSLTMSTPMFSPMAQPCANDLLTLKTLCNEDELMTRAEKPSVGITSLTYEALQAKVAAGISAAATKPTTMPADQFNSLITKGIMDQLTPLLNPTVQGHYGLTPMELATLVAAYKTYAVNLQDYYNFASGQYFVPAEGSTREWLAYKVHFTVSLQPGWYTRMNPYDAVIQIDFNRPRNPQSLVKVLYVMPSEGAQSLEELVAQLRTVEVLAQGHAQTASADVSGSIQAAKAAADRLEGLKINNTMVIGFPAANSVSIRFRPTAVPDWDRYDFQPLTRVITAVVLIRSVGPNADGKRFLPAVGQTRSITPPDSTDLGSAIGDVRRARELDASLARDELAQIDATLKNLHLKRASLLHEAAQPGKEHRLKVVRQALDEEIVALESRKAALEHAGNLLEVSYTSRFVGTRYHVRGFWSLNTMAAKYAELPDRTEEMAGQPPYEQSVQTPVPVFPNPDKPGPPTTNPSPATSGPAK